MVDFTGGVIGGASVVIAIKAVDEFSSSFSKLGTGFGTISKVALAATAAVAGFGIAMVSLGKDVTQTAISFESAFAGVRKTVELSEKDFDNLRQRFKDLSAEIPVTFEELSRIGEIAGQLGVEGVNDIEKFTKTIADISATTNLTADAAATSFARLANIMNEPIANVDRIGAAIVDLGNNFATTESEIAEFAQRIAGAANIAGLTTDQVLAIGAAFSSVGVQAEAGGTAVQKVLIGINTQVVTSGEKLELFAQTAGMTAEEFKEAWERDPGTAFAAFVNGLGNAGDDAVTILDELDLTDQRLVRSFLSLANAGDLINETLESSNSAWEENTALVEEAEKRYDTMESKLQVLKNTFRNIGDTIGTAMFPAIDGFTEIIQNTLIPAIERMTPMLQEFFIDAIGFAGEALERFLPKFEEMANIFFNELLPALRPLVPVFMDLFEIMLDLGIELMKSIVPGITALTNGFKIIWTAIKPVLDPILSIVEALLKLAQAITSQIVPGMGNLSTAFKNALSPISSVFNFVSGLVDLASNFFDVANTGTSLTTGQQTVYDPVTGQMVPAGTTTTPTTPTVTPTTPTFSIPSKGSTYQGGTVTSTSSMGFSVEKGTTTYHYDASGNEIGTSTSSGYVDASKEKEVIEAQRDQNKAFYNSLTSFEKKIFSIGDWKESTIKSNFSGDTQSLLLQLHNMGVDDENFYGSWDLSTIAGIIDILEGKQQIIDKYGSFIPKTGLEFLPGTNYYEISSISEITKFLKEELATGTPVQNIGFDMNGIGINYMMNIDKTGYNLSIAPSSVFSNLPQSVNDFILSNGQLIEPHPDDVIMGTKHGKGMGTTFIFNIEKVQGMDPDEMAEAFQRSLNKKISLS